MVSALLNALLVRKRGERKCSQREALLKRCRTKPRRGVLFLVNVPHWTPAPEGCTVVYKQAAPTELSSGGDDGLGTERPSGTSANYELNRELLFCVCLAI